MTKFTITRDMAAQIAIEPDPRLTAGENALRKRIIRERIRLRAVVRARGLTDVELCRLLAIKKALWSLADFRAFAAQEVAA